MKEKVQFAAINPLSSIIESKVPEEKYLDKDNSVISWGTKNDYPDYLLSLYNDVGTLRTVINGCIDYTRGNEIQGPYPELLERLFRDYWIYGGCCMQAIRNRIGETKFVYLDFRKVRSNKSGDTFYYSDDWSKSWGRCKYLTYPKFDINSNQPTGLIYVKNVYNQTYPTPVYGAKTTIQACEIEKEITNYHYSSILNGFTGGYLFDFHNGIPEKEEKEEIEKDIIEKYSGSGNAQRILLNFAEDENHGLTLSKLETDDFGEKYQSLIKKSQQEIFSAFRANPNLFGLPTENLGFNNEEYEATFRLFNRTMIKPVQKKFINLFRELGVEVSIVPFSLDLD